MQNILTIDYETTTHENGNFHSNKNKAVCLGSKLNSEQTQCFFNPENLCEEWISEVDLVVAFNAKFENILNTIYFIYSSTPQILFNKLFL